MTDQEKVLKEYQTAFEWMEDGTAFISLPHLGEGDTLLEAWTNAASRLTAKPTSASTGSGEAMKCGCYANHGKVPCCTCKCHVVSAPHPQPSPESTDDLRLILGVAYSYDPGKNSPRLREAYGRAAAQLGMTTAQLKELRPDVEPPPTTQPSPVAGQIEQWTCAASKPNYFGGDPQDCHWPHCGCDPNVDRVISGLEECGYEIIKPKSIAASPSPQDMQNRENGFRSWWSSKESPSVSGLETLKNASYEAIRNSVKQWLEVCWNAAWAAKGGSIE